MADELPSMTTNESQRLHRQLQKAHQRLDRELKMARQIQDSFLPPQLPLVPGGILAIHHRACGRVGGDCYDVFRLDEHHVGFYVADVRGPGVAASLLALFLKQAVQPKEILNAGYRLLAPDEVLSRANEALLSLGLPETHFITMVYGLFDARDRTFRFARAGHPHPIYITDSQEPQLWPCSGPLLGVFRAEFTAQTHVLKHGDKVLFHSDGCDLSAPADAAPPHRLLDLAARHRALPLAEFMKHIKPELPADDNDDCTVLGLEVGPSDSPLALAPFPDVS